MEDLCVASPPRACLVLHGPVLANTIPKHLLTHSDRREETPMVQLGFFESTCLTRILGHLKSGVARACGARSERKEGFQHLFRS